jgi:hypothetical protein
MMEAIMSDDEEVKREKLPTAADAPRLDGFAGYEDDVEGSEEQTSGRVIQGTLVKFTNEATWVTGGGEELSSELELIVVDIGRMVQKWHDGVPVETITMAPGQKFPNVEGLNAKVPQREWEEGPDGRPRGPWQAQHVVYLLDPQTMGRYTWPTGTTGGAICVSDLVDRVRWMRRFRGQSVFPVITLCDVFMSTRFGGRQRPYLEIKRWVMLDGGGNALPAPDQPKLPDQGAKEVKPPSAKEAAGDEIPF